MTSGTAICATPLLLGSRDMGKHSDSDPDDDVTMGGR
jgi:hypothetical protein